VSEKTLTYHGFVETESFGNPTLARALNTEARKRAKRENAGGAIFLTEDDMPSLKALMAKGEIKSAVLIEAELPAVDEVDVHSTSTDWRSEARRRVAFNLEIADQADVMDEEYVFLAALTDDEVGGFLERAYKLLDRATTTEDAWGAFLDAEAEAFSETVNHEPIPMENQPRHDDEAIREPLISLESLGIAFTRGAIGGPRPLVDQIDA